MDSLLVSDIHIPGLDIIKEIGHGAYTSVFLARSSKGVFAVKIQHHDILTGSSTGRRRFYQEAALLTCVNHSGLPTIFEVGTTGKSPYIVMEYIDGETLEMRLEKKLLDENETLHIARALSDVLLKLHNKGLVHRDIKPSNIMMTPMEQPILIDFGFVAHMDHKATDGEFVGTLEYCSPEQTGVIKRPVDGRTDLYALGTTLFECLTGYTPFGNQNISELIRQHAVLTAPRLDSLRPEISRGCCEIIAKLLAKDPDDRYQSADRLSYDLDNIDKINHALDRYEVLQFGASDTELINWEEAPIFGREVELEELTEQWNDVQKKGGRFVVIQGRPGSGKTRLALELMRTAENQSVVLLKAKCSKGSALPYFPIRQAIDGYLCQLALQPEVYRSSIEHWIRDIAEPYSSVLKDFSSHLNRLLVDVEPMDQEKVSQDVFSDALSFLLLNLAPEKSPMIFMLDDIQWIDEASLRVINEMASRIKEHPVLVLCTARTDESSVQRVINFSRNIGYANPFHYKLKSLNEEAMAQMITFQLGGIPFETEIIQQVFTITSGNPFAVSEYLRAMLQSGNVRPSWGKWIIDGHGLEGLELPSNVLELVIRRVEKLNDNTRRILQAAAIIGTRFKGSMLQKICNLDIIQTYLAIDEARKAKLIERLEMEEYVFVHDCIPDALISNLPEDETIRIHRLAAEALEYVKNEADIYENRRTEYFYDIARHYALGNPEENPRPVYEANLNAGIHAVKNYADDEAYEFLRMAEKAAKWAGIPPGYILHWNLGEVAGRTGRTHEAIAYLTSALQRTDSVIQRAQIYCRIADLHRTNCHSDPAWTEIKNAFKELDISPPRMTPWYMVGTIIQWVIFSITKTFPILKRFSMFSEIKDTEELEKQKTLVYIYEIASMIAFLQDRHIIMFHAAIRSLNIAYRIGESRELSRCYSVYAMIWLSLKQFSKTQYYIQESLEIAERAADPSSIAMSRYLEAVISQYMGQPLKAEKLMRNSIAQHGIWLDLPEYLNATAEIIWNYHMRGYARESLIYIQDSISEAERRSRRDKNIHLINHFRCYAMASLTLLGFPAKALEHLRVIKNTTGGISEDWLTQCIYHSHLCFYYLEQGELGEPIETSFINFEKLNIGPKCFMPYLNRFHFYKAYAHARQVMNSEGDVRKKYLVRLKKAVLDLKKVYPHPLHTSHRYVLEGIYERLTGNVKKAMARFEKAETLASQVDNPWVQYETALHRAYIMRDLENSKSARRNARIAQQIAIDHGWLIRERRIRDEFGIQDRLGRTGSSGSSGSSGRRLAADDIKQKHQLEALIQVSLASSTVLNPEQLVRIALDEILQILGGEQVILFLSDDGLKRPTFYCGRDPDKRDLAESIDYSHTVLENCWADQKAVVYSGTSDEELNRSVSIVSKDLRSIIAVPIILRDKPMGIVYVDNRLVRGVFDEEDVEILIAIAHHIGVSLETARTAQLEIQVKSERQQRIFSDDLRNLTKTLSMTLSHKDVLETFLTHLSKILPTSTVSHAFLRIDNQWDMVAQDCSRNNDVPLQISVDQTSIILEKLLDKKESILIPSVQKDSFFTKSKKEGAWLAVPLFSKNMVIGAIVVYSDTPDMFSENLFSNVRTYSAHAAVALDNARLFEKVQELARIDDLTGIANRRHLLELSEIEFSRASRYQKLFAGIMIDVDGFKMINDKYGHSIGDAILREVAERCKMTLRQTDILGRYGGEEFVAILTETESRDEIFSASERLRTAIAGKPFHTEFGDIFVTISLGIATNEDEIYTLSDLLKKADAALYQAKHSGKNCIVFWSHKIQMKSYTTS